MYFARIISPYLIVSCADHLRLSKNAIKSKNLGRFSTQSYVPIRPTYLLVPLHHHTEHHSPVHYPEAVMMIPDTSLFTKATTAAVTKKESVCNGKAYATDLKRAGQ
ncbi:uncharacterized protein TrAFT101_007120 [Trichoderma asperellum]|uniref:uncharacterized protein n=1 Tax=Trichoderma asperellum TaxID=101201 RepID=UPI00332BBDE5|nr:hypothetical protein TrAFT101_007120 [Trichoderma asperellum]